MTAFGRYPGLVYDLLLYVIDNEIHHRDQGCVYLRALGIEPPPFYERQWYCRRCRSACRCFSTTLDTPKVY